MTPRKPSKYNFFHGIEIVTARTVYSKSLKTISEKRERPKAIFCENLKGKFSKIFGNAR